jgi:HTH-like domain
MAQMGRPGLTLAEKKDLWRRWKEGQSLSEIGRALGKHAGSIHGVVKASGGLGFLRVSSSTAAQCDDPLHRRAAHLLRGRADLPGHGDRPIELLRRPLPSTVSPFRPGRGAESRDQPHPPGQLRGVRRPKLWRALRREGTEIGRDRVARLMGVLGLAGAVRGKRVRTTIPAQVAERPADLVNRIFSAPAPEPPLGGRPNVRLHLGGLLLHSLRHRRLQPADRGLAGVELAAGRACPRCP